MGINIIIYEDKKADEFTIEYSANGYALGIYVDDEKTLSRQLKNKKQFDICMKNREEIEKELGYDDEGKKEAVKYIKANFYSIFEQAEYVELWNYNVKEFIKKNPILLSKKIVLPVYLDINDLDKINDLIYKYGYEKYAGKLYIKLIGSDYYANLYDCLRTSLEIKRNVEHIKSLSLSPMETIMYVYDLVRNRVYHHEEENEDASKSRDISQVIFGDRIVCTGFSTLFSAYLTGLGINNFKVILDDKNENKGGHERNAVYVVDPKYGIDGLYYFDATWDSKKQEDDNSYLLRYKYFAKTKEYMDSDKQYDLEDIILGGYTPDIVDKIRKIIKSGKLTDLLEYKLLLNTMANMTNEKPLITTTDFMSLMLGNPKIDGELLISRLEKINDKFNREIPAEVMIKLLHNVRKVEYYQNPDWYPFSINAMYDTFVNSNWKFKEDHVDKHTKLLRRFSGNYGEAMKVIDNYKCFSQKNKLFENIQQVRLTKILQGVSKK